MIHNLIKEKEKFFWSKEKTGKIICGGTFNGRFLGSVQIDFQEDHVRLYIEYSNGVTSSIGREFQFEPHSSNYALISKFNDEFESFLNSKDTIDRQNNSREILLQNLFRLMSKNM